MLYIFSIIILVFSLWLLLYNTIGDIYTWFDHYGWNENSKPDKKAKIQNITQEKVKYVKNKAKIKTKFTFSDGFYFITYKTNREYKFLLYRIFISDELMKKIIELALEKHDLAVDKFKKHKSLDINDAFYI